MGNPAFEGLRFSHADDVVDSVVGSLKSDLKTELCARAVETFIISLTTFYTPTRRRDPQVRLCRYHRKYVSGAIHANSSQVMIGYKITSMYLSSLPEEG